MAPMMLMTIGGGTCMHACSLNLIARGGIAQQKLKDWNTKWTCFSLQKKQTEAMEFFFPAQ
jgi:hypothetical protein